MLYVCIRGWKIPVICMVTLSYYMLLYTLCEYILNHMPFFIFALDFSREQYSRVISEHNPFKPFKPFLGIWLSRERRRPNGWSCCSASETEQMRKCADAEYAEQMFSANSIESKWIKFYSMPLMAQMQMQRLASWTTLGVANLSHLWKQGSIKQQRLSFTHEGAPIAQVRGRKFGSPENARLVAWAT